MQRVIVLLRDRVELVVVAARTRGGHAHEALRDDVNAVINDLVLIAHEALAHREETHRRQRGLVLRRREPVAGNLLADELVVRKIVVERLDDVIAIGPRKRVVGLILRVVVPVAARVRVARHVQPVTAPTLAVSRRGEQAIHHGLESLRRFVRNESIDLGRRRRQAGEVEGRTANQRALIRERRGGHALRFELREHELVEVAFRPLGRVLHHRNRRSFHRLIRPVLASLVPIHLQRSHGTGGVQPRVRRAHANPRLEVRDDLGGEALALGRHHLVGVGGLQCLEKEAFLRLARDDGGAAGAALEQAVLAVHIEAALELLGLRGVALVAMLGERGTDFLLEELELVGIELRGRGRGERNRREARDDNSDGELV